MPCVENLFRSLMDELSDDLSKVEGLLLGCGVGKFLVNSDVDPHLWLQEC